MVFYFKSSKGHLIYMGKDKFENELLIKYSWPEDVWFHVDDLSSAHVYLRFPKPGTKHKPTPLSDIPKHLIEECSQLVKANSIEGCKKSSVDVVYTPTTNLKKTERMVTGQVGFHDHKLVIKYKVESRNRPMVKALDKTKTEVVKPPLQEELRQREIAVTKARKARKKREYQAMALQKEKMRREKERLDYGRVFDSDEMTTNAEFSATSDASAAVSYEDDFM
eukprot:g988.t1